MKIDLELWDKISPYFKPQEIFSPASLQHCPHVLDLETLKKINLVREKIGKPIIINNWACPSVSASRKIYHAGVRTCKDNSQEGGASHSMHVRGNAVDPKIRGLQGYEFYEMLVKTGVSFNGIGIYSWGLHLDTRMDIENKGSKVWSL